MSDKGLDQVILEVGATIADLDFYSYYQLIGVDEDASTDVITYQFNLKAHELEQAKRHPACNARLQQDIDLLIGRLNEARDVLCDRALRMEYDRGLELGETRHQAMVPQTGASKTAPQAPKTAPQAPKPARQAPKHAPVAYDRSTDSHIYQATDDLERKLGDDLLHADDEVPEIDDRPDAEYLDRVTDDLERQLGDEMLHSGPDDEELLQEIPTAVDREHLEALTEDMKRKLAKAGINLSVKEGFEGLDDFSGIDPEYLDVVLGHLQQKLAKLELDDEAEVEVEDRSADADFAADLVAELQEELSAMGLDMFDVAEVYDAPPEEELLDEEGRPVPKPEATQGPVDVLPGPRPKPKPKEAAPIPLPADLSVDTERLLKQRATERREPRQVHLQHAEPEAVPVLAAPVEDAVPLVAEGEPSAPALTEELVAPRPLSPTPVDDDAGDAVPLLLLEVEDD